MDIEFDVEGGKFKGKKNCIIINDKDTIFFVFCKLTMSLRIFIFSVYKKYFRENFPEGVRRRVKKVVKFEK